MMSALQIGPVDELHNNPMDGTRLLVSTGQEFFNAQLMSSRKTCRTKVPAGHAKTTKVKMEIGNNWRSVRHL
jgi:hypothetical protein